MKNNTLTPDLLHKMDAYWRAANYLSVSQSYLYDNPLLKQPLKLSHVKPTLLGHWGTTPGQNSSMSTAVSCRNWQSWRLRATGGWAPIRTQMAGCCCCGTCSCLTFGTMQ